MQLWIDSVFNCIEEKFGKVVRPSVADDKDLSFNYDTIGILVNHGASINEKMKIRWKKLLYDVWVTESNQFWDPDFVTDVDKEEEKTPTKPVTPNHLDDVNSLMKSVNGDREEERLEQVKPPPESEKRNKEGTGTVGSKENEEAVEKSPMKVTSAEENVFNMDLNIGGATKEVNNRANSGEVNVLNNSGPLGGNGCGVTGPSKRA
ncbi:hypothetical protein Hanom_Chr07g00603371 [Helianthus anomalus]